MGHIGGLIIIYPKPYSIYLRGAIGITVFALVSDVGSLGLRTWDKGLRSRIATCKLGR